MTGWGRWGWGLFASTCLVAMASVPVSLGREAVYDTALYALNAVVLGLAGALVVRRQPANPIGWVLAGLGFVASWVELTEGYGHHAGWPGAASVEWITNWADMIGIGTTAVVMALFPTGRALGRLRLALVWGAALATMLMTVGAAFSHSSDASFADGRNPHAVAGLEPISVVGQVLFTATLLVAIGTIIQRFRRSTGVEHQQLKWVAFAVALLAVVAPFAIFWYDDSALVRVAIAVVVTIWPLAVCVAILRHGLYEIDEIISRTVIYGLLTALLTGGYLLVVVDLGALVDQRGSPWVTAAATLAVAVAFRPLRSWLQDLVDQRFRRARYTALSRVDAYLDDLRVGRARPEDLPTVLREVMDRPALEVVYPPEDIEPGGVSEGRTGWVQRTVERGGVTLAVVGYPDDRGELDVSQRLLAEVLDRAVLAFEIARLQAEVHRQLAEVEASRARIVAAGYEERRRLERDLHDGAQQRLVSIGLALRHAQVEVGDSPAVRTIDAAIDELAGAIGDLRQLANGVRPAFLGHGLGVALRELAGRAPLRVEVEAGLDRYPSDVEATAYFVACEALTNAVKHARATAVRVCVTHPGANLVVTVRDDGIGGALPSDGTGLRGLSDRVAAHGGRLLLTSGPGRGTTLTAELPCAS